jgi:hypothetical protein
MSLKLIQSEVTGQPAPLDPSPWKKVYLSGFSAADLPSPAEAEAEAVSLENWRAWRWKGEAAVRVARVERRI